MVAEDVPLLPGGSDVSLGSERQELKTGRPYGFGCFQFVVKNLRVDTYASDLAVSQPETAICNPGHAPILGRSRAGGHVLSALGRIGRSQVAAPVVQLPH